MANTNNWNKPIHKDYIFSILVKPYSQSWTKMHLFNLSTFHVSKYWRNTRGNLVNFYENKKSYRRDKTKYNNKPRLSKQQDCQYTLFSSSTDVSFSLKLPNIIFAEGLDSKKPIKVPLS